MDSHTHSHTNQAKVINKQRWLPHTYTRKKESMKKYKREEEEDRSLLIEVGRTNNRNHICVPGDVECWCYLCVIFIAQNFCRRSRQQCPESDFLFLLSRPLFHPLYVFILSSSRLLQVNNICFTFANCIITQLLLSDFDGCIDSTPSLEFCGHWKRNNCNSNNDKRPTFLQV